MRCLIYARSNDSLWLKEYFPDVEPYLLKIVNKPLLEYYLDLVSLLHISELRIVSDNSIKAIENYFGNGAKWGVSITYTLARPNDSAENVYIKNYSFCKDDDLLFWDGFFFVCYDRNNVAKLFDFNHSFQCKSSTRRLIYLQKGNKFKDLDAKAEIPSYCAIIREIHSVTEYFKLSMEILTQHNKKYVLPGYSNEKDAFYGQGFIFPHTSKVDKPIMIGDNVRFRKHTCVGNSIIGDNVILDENSSVSGSIIYDNTYIGIDLEIEDKLVYKNHLISGSTGESIHINDRNLVAQVELGIVTSYFNRIVQKSIATIFIVLQFIPWLLLFLPYSILLRKHKSEFLIDKHLSTKAFNDPNLICKTMWGRMIYRLCLDKFGLLWSVLSGKLFLVGNHLLINNVEHRRLITELPVYNPGVYSLIESIDSKNKDAEEFYELEYINNCSTRMNLHILLRTITKRILHGNC